METNSIFEKLWPYPLELEISDKKFDRPLTLSVSGAAIPERYFEDLKKIANFELTDALNSYVLSFSDEAKNFGEEEYFLHIQKNAAKIISSGSAGLDRGFQTFLQLASICFKNSNWIELKIRDKPVFKRRSFMLDMGRSIFKMSYIKRIIRIMNRLKMNTLHLHLTDDELCGIRFEGLPCGTENPYSISLSEFVEIIDYASEYHIEIIPEIEAWGHAGGLVYHYPHLRGGEGMYKGSSFLICEETYNLMEKIIDQLMAVMPAKHIIHLGLEEALWFPSKELPGSYTQGDMMIRYNSILEKLARKYNKKTTMMIFADHKPIPVPEGIKSSVIVTPWNYWNSNKEGIQKAVDYYSSQENMRWMAGAGQSGGQFRGVYHATREWCRRAKDCKNIEGIDITFWMWNNLDQNFLTIFSGAYYSWNPDSNARFSNVDDYEAFDRQVTPIMQNWQGVFEDARPDFMAKDRGPIVYAGYYFWGEKHLESVAPTAPLAGTLQAGGHDFMNE